LTASAPVQDTGQDPTVSNKSTAPWLWLAEIDPATRTDWIDAHTAWLSSSEQARLQRILRPERRAQLMAGHILLRHLVAARSGLAAGNVQIRSNPDGRPELVGRADLQPSIAHSKRWVAALLDAGDAAVGVDIEFMQPERQIEKIVQLACSVEAGSREQAYLVWVQREAQIKAASGIAPVWVTTWSGHALAACSRTPPEVAIVALESVAPTPVRPLQLSWTSRPPLTMAA